MNTIVENLGKQYMDKELPTLNPGDTVKVFVRIIEGNKERTQAFEGIITLNASGRTEMTGSFITNISPSIPIFRSP